MNRLVALLALVPVLTGCTDDEPERRSGKAETSAPAPKVLTVPAFENESYGRSHDIKGCAGVGSGGPGSDEDVGYTRPVLLWFRIRTTQTVRLLPPTYAPRSNAIDSVTPFLAPDPGADAPHAAVSIGEAGEGPTDVRLTHDTHPIGDERDTPAGLAAAQASWAERAPLTRGTRLDPGDHYLFVEVDPARGGMDLHGLAANWTQDGEPASQTLGSLSLRVRCGG